MTTLVFVDLKPNSNDKDALLEYLCSPEGINKVIVGVIIVGASIHFL